MNEYILEDAVRNQNNYNLQLTQAVIDSNYQNSQYINQLIAKQNELLEQQNRAM